jgi:hypothetical protein
MSTDKANKAIQREAGCARIPLYFSFGLQKKVGEQHLTGDA